MGFQLLLVVGVAVGYGITVIRAALGQPQKYVLLFQQLLDGTVGYVGVAEVCAGEGLGLVVQKMQGKRVILYG